MRSSHRRRFRASAPPRSTTSAPQFTYGFPGFNLISVNDEIVHGIPGPRLLQPGDVVKLDITAELDGFIADAARTIVLPGAPEGARELARCARQAFRAAMAEVKPAVPVRNIGRAIERTARRARFSVLRELTGHGVGRTIHEHPTVPNFDDPRERAVLREGMVLAVEPLLSSAPAHVVEDRDGWTLRTSNGALALPFRCVGSACTTGESQITRRQADSSARAQGPSVRGRSRFFVTTTPTPPAAFPPGNGSNRLTSV